MKIQSDGDGAGWHMMIWRYEILGSDIAER